MKRMRWIASTRVVIACLLWGMLTTWAFAVGPYFVDSSTEFRVTTSSAEQSWPSISGDYVVWRDGRNGNLDIYGYHLPSRTEIRITTDTSNQYAPQISGNLVVW